MRVAIIADVHGNSWALEAVLDSISKDGPDLTVDLGDTVYGPLDPRGTAALLRSAGFPTVRGNQDRLLLEPDRPDNPTWDFVMSELTEADLAWLASHLDERTVGGRLLLFHGSPTSDQEYFLEIVAEEGVLRRGEIEIVEALEGRSEGCFACGHSHVPQVRVLGDGRTVVNPGSVGLPAYSDDLPFSHKMESGTPHANYALLDLDGPGGPRVELCRVVYAWEPAARRAAELGREDWAHAIRTGLAL